MSRNRSPGVKLFFAALIGAVLLIPLLMVYALVSDRQSQSRTAQQSITAGWGGEQLIAGPVLVIPYTADNVQTETVDGKQTSRTVSVRRELYVSPTKQSISTDLAPDVKTRSIYRSVIYASSNTGTAEFILPGDLERLGVEREDLLLNQSELRFGISDPRGLTDGTSVTVNGEAQELRPGNGPASTNGSGFSTALEWNGEGALSVGWKFGLRGSHSLSLVPRGGETEWDVKSPWQHPSFVGSFLPDNSDISEAGFTAKYEGITNLALGEALVQLRDPGPPVGVDVAAEVDPSFYAQERVRDNSQSQSASIRLMEPVDLYSQVDRSVKYGFLFIGFTFIAFFMFDVVAGAKVASAEYLLTGVGLVLFFVMLLAFAEVIGFTWAYIVASLAVIGLLTAYSAAVLGGWRRASMIGGMLTGLYATLYVLLSLEAWSLIIGSLLLFAALAAVMYATRNIEWSAVGRNGEEEADLT